MICLRGVLLQLPAAAAAEQAPAPPQVTFAGGLLSVTAKGADVRIVYSPLDSLGLAQKHPDVRVIGLSFYSAEERADEMIKAGASLYVSKTAPAEDLKKAIRSCVGDHSARVQAA